MIKHPAVSVIVPVLNAELFISKTISSILAQTFTDFELIIIDDGSRDKTKEIISSFKDSRINFVVNPKNIGVSASANKAISLSHAPLIARIDADDLMMPQRLEKQFQRFSAEASLALLGSAVQLINDADEKIGTWFYPETTSEIRKELKTRSCFAQPSVMFRKKIILAAGGYNENFSLAEDYDLWLRVCKNNECANSAELLTAYRIHENNASTFFAEKVVLALLSARIGSKKQITERKELISAGISERKINDEILKTALFWIDLYSKSGKNKFAASLARACEKSIKGESSFRLRKALILKRAQLQLSSIVSPKK